MAMHELTETSPRVSNPYLEHLLAAVGAHEVRALTISLMEAGAAYRLSQIQKALNALQGENVGWYIHSSLLLEHFSRT